MRPRFRNRGPRKGDNMKTKRAAACVCALGAIVISAVLGTKVVSALARASKSQVCGLSIAATPDEAIAMMLAQCAGQGEQGSVNYESEKGQTSIACEFGSAGKDSSKYFAASFEVKPTGPEAIALRVFCPQATAQAQADFGPPAAPGTWKRDGWTLQSEGEDALIWQKDAVPRPNGERVPAKPVPSAFVPDGSAKKNPWIGGLVGATSPKDAFELLRKEVERFGTWGCRWSWRKNGETGVGCYAPPGGRDKYSLELGYSDGSISGYKISYLSAALPPSPAFTDAWGEPQHATSGALTWKWQDGAVTTAQVSAGHVTAVEFKAPEKPLCDVLISSKPEKANGMVVSITGAGGWRVDTPRHISLAAGSYSVDLKLAGYEPYQGKFSVVGNCPTGTSKNIELKPLKKH